MPALGRLQGRPEAVHGKEYKVEVFGHAKRTLVVSMQFYGHRSIGPTQRGGSVWVANSSYF